MKKAKRFFQKTTIFFVGVLTIFGMSGLPTALAATVTDVTVSTDVIQVKFDTEVITGNPLTNWELAGAADTNSAADYRSYTFKSPTTGAAFPLSRFSPYNNTTEQGAWTAPSYELNIINFNLTKDATWSLASTTHTIKTTSPVSDVATFNFNGTVSAARAPLIANIYETANAATKPAPYALAAENTEITITGVRFGVLTAPQVWFAGNNQLTVDSYTTGADNAGTIKVKLPATINYDGNKAVSTLPGVEGFNRDPNLTVVNAENGFYSNSRPLYLYNSNYGVLYGKIVDKDGATPVDKATVIAYQPSSKWNQYQGKTQADGYFAIIVPAGTYDVEFKTPGSGSLGAAPLKSTQQVVTAGSATNTGTTAFLDSVITGYICAPDDTSTGTGACDAGKAIYGATIRAHNEQGTVEQQAETGVDGSFKLSVVPNSSYPKYVLEIENSDYHKYIKGYANTQKSLDVASNGPFAVKYKLPLPTELVTGTVKTEETVSASNPADLANDVVPGANVHLSKSDRSFDMRTQTNDLGQFTIGGAPAGTDYNLEIEPPQCNHPTGGAYCIYSRTSYSGVTINSGAATNLNLSSACATNGAIRFRSPNFFGHVFADTITVNGTYDAGEGIVDVWVRMDRSDGFFTGSLTDANGNFSFYLPNTGVYHLNAFPKDTYSSSMADVNVSTLPLTSPSNIKLSTPNVTGFVYAPGAGTTPVGGWIQMELQGGPGFGSQVDSTTGAFGINATADGTYSLRFDPQWGCVYTAPSPYTVVIADCATNCAITSVTKGGVQDIAKDATEPWTLAKGIVVRMVDPASDPNAFMGTVKGPAGTAAADVVQPNINIGLREANSSGMSRWSNTNNAGQFAFSDVPAGSYELEAIPWSGTCDKGGGQTVNCSRFRQIITVSGGAGDASRNVTIHLTSPNITGTIKTPEGTASPENPAPNTAVPQAWVNLNIDCSMGMCGMMTGGGWYGTNAQNDGTFALGGVVASSSGTAYRLEVQPPSWLTGGNVDFSVYSRKPYTLTLYDTNGDDIADATTSAGPAGQINLDNVIGTNGAIRVGTPNLKGQILKPDGATALPWVWVMVHDQTWMNQSGGNTNDQGIFTVGGLSDGTYMVEINMPNTGDMAYVPPSDLTATISGGSGTITGTGVTYDATNKIYKITMTTPKKTISGYVKKGDGTPVQFARVEANRDMGAGHFETKTNALGYYQLLVSQGAWWLNVMPSWEGGNQPDWVLNQPPLRVEFTGDNTATETSPQNFTVQACDSTITGRVMTPASGGNTSQAVQWAWVQANGNMQGMMGPGGNGSSTDSNGYFTMKVPAGTYQIMVFPNTQNYGSPTIPTTAKVASGAIKDVGTIFLTAKDAHIKGTVQDNNGNAISNVVVNAFQMGANGWANTFTNQTGAYDLLVTAGTWNVMVMPMSSDYIYQGAPKQITVVQGKPSEDNNFLLKLANRTIKVKVVDSTGTRITDIFGGVWVKDTSVNDMLEFGGANEDMMQKAGMMDATASSSGGAGATGGDMMAMGGGGPGMEKGGFTGGGLVNGYTEIKVPAGAYELGLGMPPGSDYVLYATKRVTVSATADPDPVELVVVKKNATIIGYFFKDADGDNTYDQNEVVTGIRAMVHADREGGGWSMTESNPTTGSYSIKVSAGDWYVDSFIDPFVAYGAKKYMIVADDIPTTVIANSTANRHFQVKELDSTISGHVFLDANGNNTYDAGEGIANAWVFVDYGSTAMFNEFRGTGGPSLGAFSDANGAYTISMAAGTYKVGAGVPPGVDLINPQLQTVITSATAPGTADLQFKDAAATISGYVYIDTNGDGSYQAGEQITSGFVRAWSNKNSGKGTSVSAGTEYNYSFKASLDDVWHLEAAAKVRTCSTTTATLCTEDSNCPSGETCTGAAKFYKGEVTDVATATGTLAYTKNLKLVPVAVGGIQITIPEAKTISFDASASKTIELSDGLKMEIPAQAIASSGTITVSITPIVDVKAGSTDKPITFGYDFTASVTAKNDATGQYTTTEKESDFSSNITVTFPYNQSLVTAAGYTEDEIMPQYYDDQSGEGIWKSYNNVIRDTANNTLTVKTDHFSPGGITGGLNATGWVNQVVQQVQQIAGATGGVLTPAWGVAKEAVEKVEEKVAETKEKIAEKIVSLTSGELVKSADSPDIYLIRDGRKIHIPTWEAFVRTGFQWAQVKVVETAQLARTAAVNLFKTAGDPRVYTIQDGKKLHIPSLTAFAAQGFKWEDVAVVSDTDKDIYPEITLIKTSDSPKVFYISKGLKRHITNPSVFEKSGYEWGNVTTVNSAEAVGFNESNLIRQIGDPKVYRIESDGTKRWIKTESVFKKLGYNWKNIMEVSSAEVGAYKTGTEITK